MVLKIVLGLVIIMVLVVIYAALQPGDFKIERSLVIDAPPEVIFPYVNNPRMFDTWNPFAKADSNIKINYNGPDSGLGSQSSWVGNSNVGEGSMEVVESVPPQRVRVRLDFKKPFAGTNYGEYSLISEGQRTKVTWTMTGKAALIPKIFCMLFKNMDKMLGDEFEQGLQSLRSIVEIKR